MQLLPCPAIDLHNGFVVAQRRVKRIGEASAVSPDIAVFGRMSGTMGCRQGRCRQVLCRRGLRCTSSVRHRSAPNTTHTHALSRTKQHVSTGEVGVDEESPTNAHVNVPEHATHTRSCRANVQTSPAPNPLRDQTPRILHIDKVYL